MFGWRGRLGFLVPPGCPTVEGEVPPMMPNGVTAHFSRMVAHGTTGSCILDANRFGDLLVHLPPFAIDGLQQGLASLAERSNGSTDQRACSILGCDPKAMILCFWATFWPNQSSIAIEHLSARLAVLERTWL